MNFKKQVDFHYSVIKWYTYPFNMIRFQRLLEKHYSEETKEEMLFGLKIMKDEKEAIRWILDYYLSEAKNNINAQNKILNFIIDVLWIEIDKKYFCK